MAGARLKWQSARLEGEKESPRRSRAHLCKQASVLGSDTGVILYNVRRGKRIWADGSAGEMAHCLAFFGCWDNYSLHDQYLNNANPHTGEELDAILAHPRLAGLGTEKEEGTLRSLSPHSPASGVAGEVSSGLFLEPSLLAFTSL